MAPRRPLHELPAYLLVEGRDDENVIQALCEWHSLQRYEIDRPENGGGVTQLLKSIPPRLKTPELRALGIIIDANQNVARRWQALRGRLLEGGLTLVPPLPPGTSWISPEPTAPRVGVWLMPDNQRPGVLEDFAADLIPPDDALLRRADAMLGEIERDGLRRYRPLHRPKALIHTWLAWQRRPGQSLELAVKVAALGYGSTLELAFITWLRELFAITTA